MSNSNLQSPNDADPEHKQAANGPNISNSSAQVDHSISISISNLAVKDESSRPIDMINSTNDVDGGDNIRSQGVGNSVGSASSGKYQERRQRRPHNFYNSKRRILFDKDLNDIESQASEDDRSEREIELDENGQIVYEEDVPMQIAAPQVPQIPVPQVQVQAQPVPQVQAQPVPQVQAQQVPQQQGEPDDDQESDDEFDLELPNGKLIDTAMQEIVQREIDAAKPYFENLEDQMDTIADDYGAPDLGIKYTDTRKGLQEMKTSMNNGRQRVKILDERIETYYRKLLEAIAAKSKLNRKLFVQGAIYDESLDEVLKKEEDSRMDRRDQLAVAQGKKIKKQKHEQNISAIWKKASKGRNN